VEAERLSAFRTALERARDELLDEGDITVAPNRSDPNSVRRDDDAQPLNEMNQAIASRRNAERTTRLRQIDAALVRMKTAPEDFGLCEACEEDIAARRLEVMPWAKHCIRCQAKKDPDRGGRRSSLSDYV
jgi:DnaK suppressor protein